MSRAILDSVVENNASRNYEIMDMARSNPAYFFDVEDNLKPIDWRTSSKQHTKADVSIIAIIKSVVEHINFDEDGATLVIGPDSSNCDKVDVHPELLKLLKGLCACSITECRDYGYVISEYVKALIDCRLSPQLPIKIQCDNKLQKLVLKELNAYTEEIIKKNGIEIKAEIVGKAKQVKKPKGKKAIDNLIETIDA